ncbi:CRISPR-associated endonuclease Cas3'' [Halocatena salina]|uniref:CRISPR-associated endonuclease Cas3 n=1 Tax=Halocatena salina TaxID=2934340 RepID=A0A8U0A772_9EURY|nr:CRISPR-associated endonuclease Cas3'' [Halocatena salina]UPM44854.1 CRISPR-associated endonuclease Cas3'' [Halocatena salina]
MTTYTTNAEIIARPDQPLSEHLAGVKENVDTLLSTTALGDDAAFRVTARTIAYLHDIGKLTQYFQQYIHEDDSREPQDRYRYHSLSSAFVTVHALYCLDTHPDYPAISGNLRTAAFYAVAKHHLTIPNYEDDHLGEVDPNGVSGYRSQRFDRVRTQLMNIETHTASLATELLTEATDGLLTWSDIPSNCPEQYSDLLVTSNTSPSDDFYTTVLNLWSLLTCADKLNASGMTAPSGSPVAFDPSAIQEQIDSFPDRSGIQGQLNDLRDQARMTARERLLKQYRAGEDVCTLTLPTGFGKTFTGLEAALTLAEEKDGRVIYALPYTSVIDQVDNDIQTVFNVQSGSPQYTIHHHLKQLQTRTDAIEIKDHPNTGDEVLYGETWLASLVLTTFVQLFESVAGPANTQSIKLPALQDSIIVLDEPQALSMEWWHLISRLISIVVEQYNATVIFMTATQPRIIDQISDDLSPSRLIPDRSPYLSFLEDNPRVDYLLDDSLIEYLTTGTAPPRSPASATDRLMEDITATEERETVLAICNTVRSACGLSERIDARFKTREVPTTHLGEHLLAFYEETDWLARVYETTTNVGRAREVADIEEKKMAAEPSSDVIDQAAAAYLNYLAAADTATDYLLATLTTRVRPIDRTILIACVRRLLAAEQTTPFDDVSLVITSTQLVEAGVDMSVDRLYRDVAPLPSLVQAAGRCNRSYDGADGTVVLWRLGAEDGDCPPSRAVYGFERDLLGPTRKALRAVCPDDAPAGASLPEHTMISRAVKCYYDAVHAQDRSSERDDELARYVDRACGEELRQASLIRQDYETEEILIPIAHETEYLENFHVSKNARAFEAADALLSALKQTLVSIPKTTTTQPALDELAINTEEPLSVLTSVEDYSLVHGRGVMPPVLSE